MSELNDKDNNIEKFAGKAFKEIQLIQLNELIQLINKNFKFWFKDLSKSPKSTY
ncbi:MAG: hypothetical protein KGD63_06580 [Candidatus Lokiarchaeota archaeon]|nr:hypothetical protein [Candidatus Lokiarchaeota archaeon]